MHTEWTLCIITSSLLYCFHQCALMHNLLQIKLLPSGRAWYYQTLRHTPHLLSSAQNSCSMRQELKVEFTFHCLLQQDLTLGLGSRCVRERSGATTQLFIAYQLRLSSAQRWNLLKQPFHVKDRSFQLVAKLSRLAFPQHRVGGKGETSLFTSQLPCQTFPREQQLGMGGWDFLTTIQRGVCVCVCICVRRERTSEIILDT